jgi:diacylglycerol kinase family enzyme
VPTHRFSNDRPRRVVILTNAKAGSGASREQVPRLQRLLSEAGIECEILQDMADLPRRLDSSRSDPMIVAAGGDGTLALAASVACSEAGQPVPIVPMPLGTENLLAHHFGHTADAASVLQTICRGTCYELDSGVANGRLFLIMASCGFDAEVVRGMHLTRRGHIHRLSYVRPTVRALVKYRFPDITVRIDGGAEIVCHWAMVFNLPRYAAGLNIEPAAEGDDGRLDVIAFRQGSILSGLRYLAGVWFCRHLRFRDVERQRGSVIEITSPGRVPFQLDGDYAGRLPLRIETKPRSVRLLLPARAGAGRLPAGKS